MTKPVCVQKSPFAVEVEPGDYYWCACGRSKNQPFCDGSHSGTGLEPIKFTVTQKKNIFAAAALPEVLHSATGRIRNFDILNVFQ